MQAAKQVENPFSSQPKQPSEASADRRFFVSYGVIMSVRLADVDMIRTAIERLGGKIAFQTVTTAPLYILRHYQVEQVLQGNLSHLAAVHACKQGERRGEKK